MTGMIEVSEASVENLPRELGVCHAMILDLVKTLSKDRALIERLQHQLNQLLRHRFGQRADRVHSDQLMLFIEQIMKDETAVEPEIKADPGPREPKGNGKKRGRKPLPKDLPRERVYHDVPASEKVCGQCETAKVVIREETSEQLEYVPASLKVIEHVRPILACPKGCEGEVVTATKPMQPIEKGLPGPGLVAHVVTSKYADHLPLNRQEGIFKRHGVEIAKQTQCDWAMAAAELAEPLYDLMKKEVLASHVINTDDTPVRLQNQKSQSRIWVYCGDVKHPYIVYEHTETRERDGPMGFLKGYRGNVQADAYSGYDGVFERGAKEVGCWAHARRKYVDAQTTDLERSLAAVAYIRTLYDVEDAAKAYLSELPADLSAEQRHERFVGQRYALRQESSVGHVKDFEAWLRDQSVLPKSPMGEAIGYTLNNLQALKRYLDDGELEIDNNAAERALRQIAVGRNNWVFIGSLRGGKAAAVHYSLIQSCKRNDIDPFEYLRDVFTRISGHAMSKLADFLPDRWKDLRDRARQQLQAIQNP
jgi:transposase